MTNNEIIAEFLGFDLVKFPVDFDKANASDIGAWAYGQEITWLENEEPFRIDKPLYTRLLNGRSLL